MSTTSGGTHLSGGLSGPILHKFRGFFLPTSRSVCASAIKSFHQGDHSYRHGNTHSQHDTSCSTGPIRVHDWKAWNTMGAVTHLQYSSLELLVCVHVRVCVCVCVCVCACVCVLPSGSSSLSIPRCCSALLKACSSLSIADVFFSTELQSKSSGLRRQKRRQRGSSTRCIYILIDTNIEE